MEHHGALCKYYNARISRRVSAHLRLFLPGTRRGLLLLLAQQRFVDVGNDTTARNRRLDQRVQLLVATNSQLQVARRDALHLQVFARIAGQFENLRGQVLENGGHLVAP